MNRRGRSNGLTVVRFGVSVALLVLLARYLDFGEVMTRLGELSGPWVVLGLGMTVVQVVALAWRWRFTAARLGIDLPMRRALAEYYLGIFLNQVLPGGVTGDVSRAWRHASTPAPTGQAVRAVILERLSSQVVMTMVAIVSLLALPVLSTGSRLAALGVAFAVVWFLLRSSGRRSGEGSLAGRLWADTHRALLAREALVFQMVTAGLVVASYIAVYLVSARAIGVDTPFLRLLPLVAPVLMTMLIPVTVAGWGVREGAAAGLWGVAGLTPEDGVAISIAYGLLVLVSSAPGAIVLSRIFSGGPGRTRRPDPAGTDDTPVGAPDQASGSDPG